MRTPNANLGSQGEASQGDAAEANQRQASQRQASQVHAMLFGSLPGRETTDLRTF
jgi:hypothetical protein